MDNTEKVYVTRDEDDDNLIYLWKRPLKGNWSPQPLSDCEVVNWQREDIDNMDIYSTDDFKNKFGISIPLKTKKCIKIDKDLIYNEDYKHFSNDPNRKK